MGDLTIAPRNLPARRVTLPGVSSRAYEHPADRAALVALRKLPGIDTAVRKLAGMFSDRVVRMEHLAASVRTSDRQFAALHHMLRDAAGVLDLDRVPELYVRQSPVANALTIGLDEPFIVLNTALVDMMEPEEMRFVLGHELGHAMSGHATYQTIAVYLIVLGSAAASVPLGGLGFQAVQTALNEWMRKSELSSDRAGLLVSQDRDACLRALMKLAGGAHLAEMNVEEFLAQAAEYEQLGDVRDTVIKFLLNQNLDHPLAVVRVSELDRWARGPAYEDILDGIYPLRADDAAAAVSDEAREAAGHYAERLKGSAGALGGSVKELGSSVRDRGQRFIAPMRRRGNGDDTPELPLGQ